MNQVVTIQFIPEFFCGWFTLILVGGAMAALIIRGWQARVIYSIIGGFAGLMIGLFVFTLLPVNLPEWTQEGPTLRYADLIMIFFGALVALAFERLIRRNPPGSGSSGGGGW